MAKKLLTGLILILVILTLAACADQTEGNMAQSVSDDTPTPTQPPTVTPTPTSPPPKPQLEYVAVSNADMSPIVVEQSPARGQTLAPDGSISLTFDRPMDKQSVAGALLVQQAGDEPSKVDGDLTWVD